VSATRSEAFDAYVLSESSLFVYPDKMVLKTCGTTRLLDAVPVILDLASALGMHPCRCKFSRASYLFPELQVGASFSIHSCALQHPGILTSLIDSCCLNTFALLCMLLVVSSISLSIRHRDRWQSH
jgi:hypothetical protein